MKGDCRPLFLLAFGDAARRVLDSGAEVQPQAFRTINIHLCNLSLPNDAVNRPLPWDRADVNHEESVSWKINKNKIPAVAVVRGGAHEFVSQPFVSSIAVVQVKISFKNELEAPIR